MHNIVYLNKDLSSKKKQVKNYLNYIKTSRICSKSLRNIESYMKEILYFLIQTVHNLKYNENKLKI